MIDRDKIKEVAGLYAEEQAEFMRGMEIRGEKINATVLHEFQVNGSKWYPMLKKMQQLEVEYQSKRTSQVLNLGINND